MGFIESSLHDLDVIRSQGDHEVCEMRGLQIHIHFGSSLVSTRVGDLVCSLDILPLIEFSLMVWSIILVPTTNNHWPGPFV